MGLSRPRIYSEDYHIRYPSRIPVSRNHKGRIKFLKLLTGARNEGELLDLALDALQEKISVKNKAQPA